MILAIDIGATKTWLARQENGRLVKSRKIKTHPDSARFLRDLHKLIRDFLGPGRGSIKAIGIGAPGPLDPDRGVFGRLPNLPDWEGFDIHSALAACYRVPVRVQNDANAAALGEVIHGGGRGYRSVYYITISTGIGGGFVLDRKIVDGANHVTGEIWAMPVSSFGRPDILLNSSSGPGIVRTAKALLEKGEPSSLSSLESFDTETVFQQAELGDPLCHRVMENATRNMAHAIVAVLLVVDPEVILIGGGLAASDDCMINPIRKALPEIAHLEEHRHAPIYKAELWEEAVLYGAVSLFHD